MNFTLDPSIREQQVVRNELNCKPFEWYISHVYPELLALGPGHSPTLDVHPAASIHMLRHGLLVAQEPAGTEGSDVRVSAGSERVSAGSVRASAGSDVRASAGSDVRASAGSERASAGSDVRAPERCVVGVADGGPLAEWQLFVEPCLDGRAAKQVFFWACISF